MPHVDQPARGFFSTIAAWIGAVGRSAADRDAIARMSDRELSDIGLGCLGTRGAAERPFVARVPY
jgi:uncharacterized protein YjiS (DUF1127 family)